MPPKTTLLSRLLSPAGEMQLTGWLFLRLLALIYGIAFFSLAGQMAGLAGPQGILPLDGYLADAEATLGPPAEWFRFPTLFWFLGAGDASYNFV